MNHGIHHWFSLSVVTVLLLAGCQSSEQALLPVTGAEVAEHPAAVQLAHNQVLDYLITSSRLPGVPSSADWQPVTGGRPEGEYHFRSGDWLMIIRSATAEGENLMVSLINQVDRASWTGYITPDGRLVDTAYYR